VADLPIINRITPKPVNAPEGAAPLVAVLVCFGLCSSEFEAAAGVFGRWPCPGNPTLLAGSRTVSLTA
jgi:hypothetical protein